MNRNHATDEKARKMKDEEDFASTSPQPQEDGAWETALQLEDDLFAAAMKAAEEQLQKAEKVKYREEVAKGETPEHEFSLKMEGHMEEIFRRWDQVESCAMQKQRNILRKSRRKTVLRKRTAALCAVLIVFLSGIAWMTPSIFASFVDIFTRPWENGMTLIRYFTGKETMEKPRISVKEPSWIPKGFVETQRQVRPHEVWIHYEGAEQKTIDYDQSYLSATSLLVNTEGADIQTIVLEHQEVSILTNQGITLIWWNDVEYLYQLNSDIDSEDLISVAKSLLEAK